MYTRIKKSKTLISLLKNTILQKCTFQEVYIFSAWYIVHGTVSIVNIWWNNFYFHFDFFCFDCRSTTNKWIQWKSKNNWKFIGNLEIGNPKQNEIWVLSVWGSEEKRIRRTSTCCCLCSVLALNIHYYWFLTKDPLLDISSLFLLRVLYLQLNVFC